MASTAIKGFDAYEQGVFDRLSKTLAEKKHRNLLRAAYMDGKQALRHIPPTAPPYLKSLAIVLGWPAKAVEALHRRTALEGFYATDVDLDGIGLTGLLEQNDYIGEASMGELEALISSCAFEIVTEGGPGEPAAVITQKSAVHATGDWNPRARRLDSLLSVHEYDDYGEPLDFDLHLPGLVISVVGREVVARKSHRWHVLATVIPNKPRIERPFGSSRISRAVMSLTDSAARTMIRSEGTADLYGVPWFVIFGPDRDAFDKGSWQMIMDRINAIPDNENAPIPRADVKQFSQGDQRPHVEQLQTWAGLFAGETSIPVSSLGVGLSQANPTSADSYVASREDLIAEAEAAARAWRGRHAETVRNAWAVANGDPGAAGELSSLRARYRNPRFVSQSAASDAALKQVQAFPWMAESDAFVEHVFQDSDLTTRLLADKRRAQGRAALARFQGGLNGGIANGPEGGRDGSSANIGGGEG